MSLLSLAEAKFKNLSLIPDLAIDLKYASTNNFVGENVYGDFTEAFLHPEAFEKLLEASRKLQLIKKGWKIIVFDALRPFSLHLKLFEKVRGTPEEIYVAHPNRKSVHNFGMAVDLSLLDEMGNELDMGTHFDAFVEASQPQLETRLLAEGKITKEHISNRDVLRAIMESAGFTQLPHEWWHFDAANGDLVRTHYEIFV